MEIKDYREGYVPPTLDLMELSLERGIAISGKSSDVEEESLDTFWL